MHTMFHRTKRFILILAGTAALSAGAVVPAAMAEPPTGSGGPDHYELCEEFHDAYDGDISNATHDILTGNLLLAAADAEAAAQTKIDATAAGCDTSTWATAGSPGTVALRPIVAPVEATQP